jgi:protease II
MTDVNQVLISQLEKFITKQFDQMETKIEEIRKGTKEDIESIRAKVENLYTLHESRNGNDHAELHNSLEKLEKRILDLELKPKEEAFVQKKGFLGTGQELATKAVWTVFLGFVGFLVWNYIQNGGH